MVNYREIIKLKSENFSNAAIAVNVGSSRNTVATVINLAEKHELSWPLPEDLSNHKIERIFYPDRGNNEGRKLPDSEYIHNELAKPGVTLTLLWGPNIAKNVSRNTLSLTREHSSVISIALTQLQLRQLFVSIINLVKFSRLTGLVTLFL